MTEQTMRAARLWQIEGLLRRRPQGYSSGELARELGCSTRTIQRDLLVLQIELGAPVEDAPHRRYRIDPAAMPLSPVRFTLHEARAMYLAGRLFLRYADERDPDGASALEKLAEALPASIGEQVRLTARQVRERPEKKGTIDALRTITEAWARSHTVRMLYRSAGSDEPKEVHLDPYLLEPSTASAATYVMGYSHEHNAVRTFKMERIAEVETTNEAFEPSHVDEILEQLARSWGVVYGGEEEYDITVDFSPNVADRVRESYWNPAQKLEDLTGGGVRLSLRLPSLMEFEPWVRSWGGDAVVVEPLLLRERVAASMRAAASLYA